ncbi:MAG: hypothetical protein ABIS45_00615 [Burkholderiales bacterium]
MKVLHLPSSVGGNARGLAQGERALGLDSSVMAASDNWLAYQADISLNLQNSAGPVGKLLGLSKAFLAVRNKYDVFHFNAGSSLIHSIPYRLNHLDLPFYPSTAKLFVTYNGCDARQKFPTIERTAISACRNPRCYHGMCNYGAYDEQRRRSILKMARYVRHMWAVNPDLLHFLPRERASFLPYSISWDHLDTAPLLLKTKLKIVHAPTNREAKGSEYILAALGKLANDRPEAVDIRLIENIPHREAIKLYQEADLVIDQIVIGWYGGFAVETMKMGKPVIARIASEDLQFVPAAMAHDVQATVINADPDTIYDVLVKCVEDRTFLREKSQASIEYAHKWHDPKYVASLTKEKYEAA